MSFNFEMCLIVFYFAYAFLITHSFKINMYDVSHSETVLFTSIYLINVMIYLNLRANAAQPACFMPHYENMSVYYQYDKNMFLLSTKFLFVMTASPSSLTVVNSNFQPLEVVSRYCDPQLQVDGNYSYLGN